jgi:hypothetical protein
MKARYFGRWHLPPTKSIDKKLQIVSQMTLVVHPALRLEFIRIRINLWISGDGPEGETVRSFVS